MQFCLPPFIIQTVHYKTGGSEGPRGGNGQKNEHFKWGKKNYALNKFQIIG
jgi:hypothetical protein